MSTALPARVAYITINNAPRRNALSLATLRDIQTQLVRANTNPQTGQVLLLPPFKPSLIAKLERAADSGQHSAPATAAAGHGTRGEAKKEEDSKDDEDYSWLVSSRKYAQSRAGLPNVLVLRSSGPVFSSGHDLSELRSLPAEQVKETFALCAAIMTLIRRSPAVVVGRIQGLATAAGAQLALTCDLPVALKGTGFKLPGAGMGLPCTTPSTAVSRRVGNAKAFRIMALAETWAAEELGGAVDVVGGDVSAADTAREDREKILDDRVAAIAARLASMPAQPAALGKWAYWTQASLQGQDWVGPVDSPDQSGQMELKTGSGGDGYEDAVVWAGRMMALYARSSDDAREGMAAFLDKREPVWVSNVDGDAASPQQNSAERPVQSKL